ncbi:MAG: hypothetical protein Q9159_005725 [Coniocarpon cinnabarinum]
MLESRDGNVNVTEQGGVIDVSGPDYQGGANGIGAAFVRLCHQRGAHIFFGDADKIAGETLTNELNAASSQPRVAFVLVDVANYSSLLELFRKAYATHRRIDAAVSCAGIQEAGKWFDPELDIDSVSGHPSIRTLDVNLLGTLYFARIAAVYLRQDCKPGEDRSLTLIASVAAFKDAPGIFAYQASKHGVLGLMRSLRTYLPSAFGVRVNTVCPWMTRTIMTSGIETDWYKAKLPVNEPEDVARVLAEIAVSNGLNGKSMYVEGGRAWEIEENLEQLEPQWLGKEPSRTLNIGQKVLGTGENWSAGKSRL